MASLLGLGGALQKQRNTDAMLSVQGGFHPEQVKRRNNDAAKEAHLKSSELALKTLHDIGSSLRGRTPGEIQAALTTGPMAETIAKLTKIFQAGASKGGIDPELGGLMTRAASAMPADAPKITTAAPGSTILRDGVTVGQAPSEAGGGPFEGKGFPAQTANALILIGPKIKAGTATPEEVATYAVAHREATEPKVVGNPDQGFKLVTRPPLDPAMFPSPAGAGDDASVTEITKPKRTPERAGRIAMVEQGAKNIMEVRDALVKTVDGKKVVDRGLIATMSFDLFGVKGVPGTEGRKQRSKFEDVASTKLRLETGAQANESEIQGLVDRFMPSLFDNDATIIDKMDRMTKFFERSLEETDPELYEKLIGRTVKTGKSPAPPSDEPGAVFAGFTTDGDPIFRRPDGSKFKVTPDG